MSDKPTSRGREVLRIIRNVLAVLGFIAWMFSGRSAVLLLSSPPVPSTSSDKLNIDDFARIPVIANGRLKPMDTIARTHLRIVSNRETFRDLEGTSHPAIEWLLDVETEMFSDREARARKHRVFRIDHPQLLDALGLQPREGYRYSIDDFAEKLTSVAEPLKKAHERKDSGHALDPYENQLFEFERHLGIYQRLSQFALPHVIPPKGEGEWRTLPEAVPKNESVGMDPHVDHWKQMLTAYGAKDVPKFNSSVEAYLKLLNEERPKDVERALIETRFNRLDLFNTAKWIYLLCFVLTFVGFLKWETSLRPATSWILAATFVVHTFALGARIFLSGRPPVTNLYSSAIFIGWGAVLLGLVLERIYKLGVGNIIAAVSGFVTLQIAHILAADGDTMEVLQAVLDTQFWLATHVTCITLGYATTYVAGLLGVIFIVRGVFTPSLTPEIARNLARMTYGTVCFATFFSFVGTVLGGLWADDSWGRFWGWDPKENGALLIVLWNALLLHARWGGMVRERGIAILAVIGNIVVSWSWFGVNQLGVGLHSYGFTNGVTLSLWASAISQAALAGCGLFPPELWRSKLGTKGASAEAAGEGDA